VTRRLIIALLHCRRRISTFSNLIVFSLCRFYLPVLHLEAGEEVLQ
jgi:hypothetical protein